MSNHFPGKMVWCFYRRENYSRNIIQWHYNVHVRILACPTQYSRRWERDLIWSHMCVNGRRPENSMWSLIKTLSLSSSHSKVMQMVHFAYATVVSFSQTRGSANVNVKISTLCKKHLFSNTYTNCVFALAHAFKILFSNWYITH